MSLQMYDFLIKPLRDEDASKGRLFLQRLLMGPQAQWDRTRARIDEIPTLWSVLNCDDEQLQRLKRIVGWTKDLDTITERLSSDLLRRLIAVSAKLWKDRGPEDTTIDILRVLTGMRSRIWNWFDLRFVMDETQLGEDSDGHDPFLLSGPGYPGEAEFRSNLRIVDLGNLDRTLVSDVVRLMRPVGERVEITYLAFLDLFDVDGDYFQWRQDSGTSMRVSDGRFFLDDSGTYEVAVAAISGASSWGDAMSSARIRTDPTVSSAKVGICFHWANVLNFRLFYLDVTNNQSGLLCVQSGVPVVLALEDMEDHGIILRENTHYMLRTVTTEVSGDDIQCYVDGNKIIEVNDPVSMTGSSGLWHDSGTVLEATEFEVAALPIESEEVGIN